MKFKISTVVLTVLFVASVLELLFNLDLTWLLFVCHNHETCFVDVALPISFVIGISLVVDYSLHSLRKKEKEKSVVYRQTIFGMNHLVRSLQSKFVVITDSESVKKEFGEDIIALLRESSAEIEGILNKLAALNKADPVIIKDILSAQNRCNICGCERVNPLELHPAMNLQRAKRPAHL
ncbi:hypothetical protein [Candidatus Electronema sp. JC]|uniref:hypothetical protein n=1 Tax=Candidatus Electronema sp. JC TaxID=3401570 RepID=UPI003B4311F8